MIDVLFINGPLKGQVESVEDRFKLLDNSKGFTHRLPYQDKHRVMQYWVKEVEHEGTKLMVAAVKTTITRNGTVESMTIEELFERYVNSPVFDLEDIAAAEVK